jgi:hypothetical protein
MAPNQNKIALIFFWILSLSLITFSISTFSQSFSSIATLIAGIALIPPINTILSSIFRLKKAPVVVSIAALAFAVFGLTFNQVPQNTGSVLGVNEVKGEITNEVSIPESGQVIQTQTVNPALVDLNSTPPPEPTPEQPTQNPVQRIRVSSPVPDIQPQSAAPPVTPEKAPDMTNASDTGEFDDDNKTFNQTPTFIGSCVSNNIVTLLVDGNEKLPTIKCVNGSYFIALGSKIPQGKHGITSMETTPDGSKTGQSPALYVEIIVPAGLKSEE